MAGDVRTFTLREANALLPEVRELLGALRDAVERQRFHGAQVRDLRGMHGADVEEPGHGAHDEFREHGEAARSAKRRADALLAEFRSLGVEVKDPIVGLVDFYHLRGDRELVYLCWQEGEDEIAAWHTLTGGFAGRRPVEEL